MLDTALSVLVWGLVALVVATAVYFVYDTVMIFLKGEG